ncbi:thiolase family protein [Anaerolineales bacterium]
MADIVIVDALRSPLGRRNGWLREEHPVKLGAHVVRALLERNGIKGDQIDHLIFGCVSQISEQTFNIARNVTLEAGLPIEVPATTIDFQCGSSQQAVHLAQAMVASGQAKIVIAGGVESMTRVPMGSSLAGGFPFTDYLMETYEMINQGQAADEIAQKWDISREELDQLSLESHQRAWKATQEGWFKNEIVPISAVDDEGKPFTMNTDQGIRPNAVLEKMAQLKPAFTAEGVTTAANSSQITDGAAAVLVMASDTAQALGLKPRARIVACVTVGSDPHLMLTGPVSATEKVLERAGLSMEDIDLFEVNEAFAVVVKMWEKETQADMDKVNVHGSSIALGHPLGGSGARLMTTLVHALETHQKRYGLQTMCCGGGMATGTIIERLD